MALREKQIWLCNANMGGFTGIFIYLLIKLSQAISKVCPAKAWDEWLQSSIWKISYKICVRVLRFVLVSGILVHEYKFVCAAWDSNNNNGLDS